MNYRTAFRRLYYLAAALVSVLWMTAAVCADVTTAVPGKDMGFMERVFTYDDGLATTSTLTVAQTPDGFIWLGGYGGLTRYDGREFVTQGGKRLSNVRTLCAQADGTLWIGSLDCGLVRMRGEEFYFYEDEPENSGLKKINSISSDVSGRIWFTTGKKVGYVDSSDKISWIGEETTGEYDFESIICGEGGLVWAKCSSGDVYLCGDQITKMELPELDASVRSIDCNPFNNCLYVGTEKCTILVLDPEGNELSRVQVPGINSINGFEFLEADTVCAISDDGMAVLSGEDIYNPNLRVSNSLEDIMLDADGNIWITSSRQGVLIITPGRFHDISLDAALPKLVVNAIAYKDGRLYIGHDSGLEIIDEKTYEIIDDKNFDFLNGKRIRDIYIDNSGGMWFCTTGDGLYHRGEEPSDWEHYSKAETPGLGSDKFRCVVETSLGLTAGTDGGGYLIKDGEAVQLAEGLDVRVLALTESNGRIYAGTDGNGVFVIKDGKIEKQLTLSDGLSTMRAMKIRESTDGKGLWLATGNNVEFYDFETGRVTHSENFPPANVLDCIVLEDGTLWILAGNGIFSTTEDEVRVPDGTPHYRHYTGKHGIPYDITANSYQAIVGDSAYICGADGIAWMDLDPKSGIPSEYKMLIDYVVEDGERCYVDENNTIDISKDVKRFEVEAHMMTYTQENPTLYYYLEGFETDRHRVPFEKLSTIVYTNIPGGEYTLHFGVLDPGTGDERQEITLQMNVELAWFEHPSVMVLVVCVLLFVMAAVIWGIFSIRSSRATREMSIRYNENEQKILQEMAYTDYLTGLNNRNYLNHWEKTKSASVVFPLAVISIDCNNLKFINDKFGHDMGDHLLQTITELLRNEFQGNQFVILRIGGDEFLVIAEGMTLREAEMRIESLIRAADAREVCGVRVGFCYGIATCQNSLDYDLEFMMKRADEQLIKSKQLFHSRIYYEPESTDAASSTGTTGDTAGSDNTVTRHMKNDVLRNVLYEAFAEASESVYIYVLDMNSGISRWSKNCVEFFGLPGEYLVEAEYLWLEHIHPDDRQIYLDDIMGVFEGLSDRHSCQYRAINRYGEYVWVECKGRVIRSSNGRQIFAGLMTRLDSQSTYDPLTGLKTKNQFYNSIHECDRGAALLVGVDDFKDIISIYGYACGDDVLVKVGKLFLSLQDDRIRTYRFNGDEFVFVIPGGGEMEVEKLFRKISGSAGMVTLESGVRLNLSFSGGAAYYDMSSETADSMINRLELSLDYVKQNWRGNYLFYSEDVLASENRRILIKKELQDSIVDNFRGFELYFQPIMNGDGTMVLGAEALLRWQGILVQDATPTEFIPILEENDSIVKVGQFVMQEAMKQKKIWASRYGNVLVSVNVSYRQFLVEGYARDLYQTALDMDVDPSGILIELTESCRVQAPQALAQIFSELRSYGFKIALDDFGTGYATLEMLKKLPCDGIKIEHNFVRELEKKGKEMDFAIIRSILLLCESLGLKVVLEGVENEDVASIVRGMEVDYLQGYYYSPPVSRSEFDRLIEENHRLVIDSES